MASPSHLSPSRLTTITDTQVQHELVAELVNRGVLTSAGAEEVCHDLIGDKRALASERRRKQAAVALLHVDHARGRAVDLTASQQQILDLRMTNAFRSASTRASTAVPDDVTVATTSAAP